MSVAVVTPIYRPELQAEELVSLRHLRAHLAGYDCYQISPCSLGLSLEGFKVRPFDNEDFASVDSYSRLMLSTRFYETFAEYDYVLIYQLDCLVFSDQLRQWCDRGFDYIGAPLFRVKNDPASGFSGACNGGLSLRKISSFLKVLNSHRYSEERIPFFSDLLHQPFIGVRPLGPVATLQKRMQVARDVRQGVQQYTATYKLNEDHFWSGRAGYFEPTFRVAPPEVALQFAFEAAPEWCFQRNGRKLPFGAHAWQKWNPYFWKPFVCP